MMETERLILPEWRPEHRAPLVALNADPENMRYFERVLTAADTDRWLERAARWNAERGFTFWPVIRKSDGVLLGITGLKPLTVPWVNDTDIEIGWRFDKAFWGQGYARESAAAVLDHGLSIAPRVIAMTVEANAPSWGLMRRLGMRREPALDLEHPDLPVGHPLRPHIVYVKDA